MFPTVTEAVGPILANPSKERVMVVENGGHRACGQWMKCLRHLPLGKRNRDHVGSPRFGRVGARVSVVKVGWADGVPRTPSASLAA